LVALLDGFHIDVANELSSLHEVTALSIQSKHPLHAGIGVVLELTLTLGNRLVLVGLTLALLGLVCISRDVVAPGHRQLLRIRVEVVDAAELPLAVPRVVRYRVPVRLELVLARTVLRGLVDVLSIVHQ